MNDHPRNKQHASPAAGEHPLAKSGRLLDARQSKLIKLGQVNEGYVVLSGKMDLFVVLPSGRRLALTSVQSGNLLLGLGGFVSGDDFEVMAVGDPDARLLSISQADLQAQAADPVNGDLVLDLIAGWLEHLVGGIDAGLPPKHAHDLAAGSRIELKEHEFAEPANNKTIFVRWTGKVEFLSKEALSLQNDGGLIPFPANAWLSAKEDLTLEGLSLKDCLREPSFWQAMDSFHRLLGHKLTIEVDKLRRWESSQLEKRRDLDDSLLNRAYQRIAEIFNPDAAPEAMTAPPGAGLFAVCRLVGRKLDIDFQNPGGQKQYQSKGDMDQALRDIAQASRVRMRYVALRGHWWNKDLGPLVAFVGEERKPVALLPESPHQYMLIDPESGERKAVDAAVAEGLYPFAVFFYRSLPQRIQSGRELVKFGFKGCRADFNIILTMVLVAGLLGLVTPLGTEVIFSDVIPKANMSYLWQIFMILLACYLASGALNLVRDFAVLRIAGKMESSLEAAVWDRLLNLAPPFFKKYASGDLALRAMGINTIRQMASNVVVSNTLGGLASSLNLLVMFYYSWRLSLLGIGLAVIAVSITVITTRAQLAHQRVVFDIQGKISALVIQMVNGINKLRSAGAENRAFSVWARKFSDQKKETLKAGKISNILQAINAGLPILSTAAIFTWLAFYDESDIEMSEFLAFNTAFGTFLSSCLMMSTSLIAMLNAVPVYERLRPIIEAEPETDPHKGKPGELSGRVAMHKLSFRYQSDGPLILQGIDLVMQPGEFVALVGPSGSGKSTMLRLLLGFETPEEGSIFYDQYDLASVDCHEIRRQIGVVLQSAQLMTGTIFSNIAGSANVSQEQAWEAARLAGFEKDIKAMPMGLETMVSEGGSTLSGGQRQRLLIARALIKRPRILYFDEATSALDNQTQSVVARSLEQLRATRLVIAHRLSTVINADRIVVLKDGRIVEQGPYDQLIKAGGEFEQLARRQLA